MIATAADVLAALAGIDQALEAARAGSMTPETLIDRVHGYQRSIAGAGVTVIDDHADRSRRRLLLTIAVLIGLIAFKLTVDHDPFGLGP